MPRKWFFTLSAQQRTTLVEVCLNVSQVILASIVIEPMINQKINVLLFGGGLVSIAICWSIGLILSK